MRLPQLRQRLRDLGAAPCHEGRVLRAWVQGRSLDTKRRRAEDFLPLAVRDELPAIFDELQRLAHVHSEHPGEDGSARLLVQLADGQTVESVLLPRDGVCVSTQVGCAVGCVFCMTGRAGLLRQLSSAEIVAQVVLARSRRPVKKVVFMGMGEPAHNLDNVLEAIELLGVEGGIGHKNLVFSTVGDRRVFERLPQSTVKPALALSLHTTDHALRRRLLPKAPDIAPAELVELGEAYARRTGYPIQYQWTLLEGINDSEAELEGIARLLAGRYAVMNLIPYNSVEGVDGSDYRRPSWERAAEMARRLHVRGILTKLRHSAGQDVEGGCGQLRARVVGVAVGFPRCRRARTADCFPDRLTGRTRNQKTMNPKIAIRNETAADVDAITEVTVAAFRTLAISNHTEQFVIAALRAAGALTLSLVAEVGGRVIGHIAFSPVTVSDGTRNWYGLGPVSVLPAYQRQGIGKALIREGLARLKAMNARGCCLVGHPDYYRKFGFINMPGLVLDGVPPEVFFALSFDGKLPQGSVAFHEAFKADGQ